MFSDTFPDRIRAEKHNEYLDEDIPDEDNSDNTNATPESSISPKPSRSGSPSSSQSPLANKSHVPPQYSMSGWDMCKTMCLAGGTGLEQVIAVADQAGLPVASERAGGDSRRAGLK
jgi:hypothetical protein